MKKKIIGYKLTNVISSEEVARILDCNNTVYEDGMFFKEWHLDGASVNKAIELKVLDIWFEPVYLEDQYKVGDYVIFINAGGWGVSSFCRNSMGLIEEATHDSISGTIFDYEIKNPIDKTFNKVPYLNNRGEDLFRLATKPEIAHQISKNRFNEAKELYPIGTKFIPAHKQNDNGEYCIVVNDKFKVDVDSISSLTEEGRNWANADIKKYGNTSYNRLVWFEGKWATILSKQPVIAINGYTAEFTADSVKFGCAEIGKDMFITLDNEIKTIFLNTNRKIESVKIGEGTFTAKDIEKIVNFYKYNAKS